MSLILSFAFPTFHYRPMRDADSVVLDLPAAPAVAAEFVFHYRTFRGCIKTIYYVNQDVGQESDGVSSSHTASLTWFAWLSFH